MYIIMKTSTFWKSRLLWVGLLPPAVLALLLYGLKSVTWVCEYIFARGITRWLTTALTWVTNWIPVSMAEIIIYCIPVVLVLLIVYCITHSTFRHWRSLILGLVSVVLWGICLFELLFVIQFGRIRLEDHLEYNTQNITAQELYETALIMRERAVKASESVEYTADGYSVWKGCTGLVDSNKAILEYAYHQRDFTELKEEFDLAIYTTRGHPKGILASQAFSYTQILGIYIPFTGEANLNTEAPPFIVAVSSAHEQAHQKGYSREDEANFLAIQTCLLDENEYMQYSGSLYAFRFLYNALYDTDPELYFQLMEDTPEYLKTELRYYNDWLIAHRSQAATVTEKVNNTYLEVSGGVGTISYSLVVELLIGQYRSPEV